MADIKKLVPDIYSVLSNGAKLTEEQVETFSKMMGDMISRRLSEEKSGGYLRMSNLGTPCDRKLWYTVNQPERAESLPPHTRLKFLYGDMVELLLVFLADVAGHKVEAQGEEVELNGVKGHIDGIVDGVLVDFKSASGRGFDKFKYHKLESDDPFGYLAQLGSYLAATKDDPRVLIKGEAGFLAIDKEQGHLTLDSYRFKEPDSWYDLVERKKEMVAGPIPPRAYNDVPDGASGNRKLCMECSYCPFKEPCWPGLQTFVYSSGPRFMTVVMRPPKVEEYVKGF